MANGVGDGCGPRVDAELVEDVRDMRGHGPGPDVELVRDLAVGMLFEETQDIKLAGRQTARTRDPLRGRYGVATLRWRLVCTA